jgi:hypothetical protein
VQAALPGGKRVFVSVETIAGSSMTHHYIEEIGERSHLRAISSNSELWWNSAILPPSVWEPIHRDTPDGVLATHKRQMPPRIELCSPGSACN